MRGYLENVLLPLGSTIQETLRNYLGKLNSYLEDYRFIDSATMEAIDAIYQTSKANVEHDRNGVP